MVTQTFLPQDNSGDLDFQMNFKCLVWSLGNIDLFWNAPQGRITYLCWKQDLKFLKLPHVQSCSFHKPKIVERLPVNGG